MRRLLNLAFVAALLVATPALALDNIEIMAPAAPGGGYDRTSRAIQATIEKEGLGKGITVINVGGAGGAIGLAQFIRNKAGRSDALIVGGFGMVASSATNRSKVTLERSDIQEYFPRVSLRSTRATAPSAPCR